MDKDSNIKNLDTYLSLCTEIYELNRPHPPEDAYAFYRDYAKKANGFILEPMCGSGRFLLPLLEEGFNIHGFDASNHMLEASYAKAKAKNLEATVWKSFVKKFKVIIYQQAQLIEMLKSSRFKYIRILKAFDSSKQPSNKDKSIVYECRK